MPAFAPGAMFLGKAKLAAQANTIGPVAIPVGYGYLQVQFFIAGYAGAGGIAMIQLGTTSAVDTGTNYSSYRNHFTTAFGGGSSNISQAGVHVANDATTNARRGIAQVWNPQGENKIVVVQTVTYSAQNPTAASAMASQSNVSGAWFNTGQALSVALNVSVGLLANSTLAVYGIPGTS